jgi:hypothetical protein
VLKINLEIICYVLAIKNNDWCSLRVDRVALGSVVINLHLKIQASCAKNKSQLLICVGYLEQ